jgi:two-component system sensor histidine kinase KdpD
MADTLTPTAERLLVCVGPGPSSAKVINSAKRMADSLQAEWFAVYVESPRMLRLGEGERNRIAQNLRLAEELGGETFILRGRSIAEEIVNFARQRNVSKIVSGKPVRSRWKDIFCKSPVDELVRLSGDIDIYVITGEPGELRESIYLTHPKHIPLSDYGAGLLYFILATGLCFLMFPYFHLSNLIMVYLLGVMITAMECGRGPAILNSLLSVLSFDFFFVPPRFSFAVEEAQYLVTFAVMFLVAVVISHLTNLIRQQAEDTRLQERQTAAMHGLSRQLASVRGVEKISQVAVEHFSEIFKGQVVVLLPEEKGKLKVAAGDVSSVFQKDLVKELDIARSAYDVGQMVGWGTKTSPETDILYVPLQAAHDTLGIVALRPQDPKHFLLPEQLYLLESLTKQVALALKVERLVGNEVPH